MFFAIAIYIVKVTLFLVLTFVNKWLASKKVKKYLESLSDSIFFKDILVLTIEGYIEFIICGFLNL